MVITSTRCMCYTESATVDKQTGIETLVVDIETETTLLISTVLTSELVTNEIMANTLQAILDALKTL